MSDGSKCVVDLRAPVPSKRFTCVGNRGNSQFVVSRLTFDLWYSTEIFLQGLRGSSACFGGRKESEGDGEIKR